MAIHDVSCGCPQCRASASSTSSASAAAASAPAASSGTDYIDALLAGGGSYTWNSTIGTAATVTYSFLTSLPSIYRGSDESDNFVAFNDAQKTAAREVLSLWSEVSGLTFTETTGSQGQIRFGTANLPSYAAGWAYYPSSGTGGDVWITNFYEEYADPTVGSYAYSTFIHEVGHALGLKHPGNYNADGGGEEGPYLPTETDSEQYTVMSYNSHPTTTASNAWTPMLYDIAAIQYLYGANTSTRSGDTSYSWNTGEAFIQAIWDAGGTDTIDMSNQTATQTIDLRAGYFSSLAGYTDNLAIAYGVVLENAVGGSGADTLISNSSNNTLTGGSGVDTYQFSGTWGVDTVNDGGTNTITLDVASSAVTLRRDGRDLEIVKTGTSDAITVVNAYDDASSDATQAWTITATDGNLSFGSASSNQVPVASASDGSLASGASAAIGTYFSVSDPEGDTITKYRFWDSGSGGSSAYITVNGAVQAANQSIEIDSGTLSSTTVTGGAGGGTDQLWVAAYDGTAWGDWVSWTLTTTGGNSVPVSSGSDKSMAANLSVLASTMFSVSDTNGDTITAYEFWDSNTASGSGYFTVNGAQQGANQTISVSSGQLASTYFVAGSASTSDQLWVRAYDGTGWGDWVSWTVTTTANTPPTAAATASSQSATSGQTTALSGLFSVSDADGNSITQYEFWDSGGDSGTGYVTVNGAAQSANTAISVSSDQLSSSFFVGGAANGSETLWVRAYDGSGWSDWISWTMTTTGGNAVPTVSAGDARVYAGTANAVSSLFTASDVNSDTITAYEFWDSGAEEGGGYFTVGGVAQNPNQTISVSSGQLASTYFVAGSRSVSDLIWVRAYDGTGWSEWTSWTMTSNLGSAPTISVTAASQSATSGVGTAVSTLFTASDADGQSITNYEFWDSGTDTGTGHFALNGTAQSANQVISVSASALATTTFVGGAANVSETVWVRAQDGGIWSDWTSWTMTTTGGNAPPTVTATDRSVAANASVALSTLFSATDSTPDTITTYELWDSGTAAGSGYFSVGGVQQGAAQVVSIDSGQFASATYTGGSSAGSELVWARAFDGTGWSDWTSLTATTSASGTASAAMVSLTASSRRPETMLA